MFQHSFTECSAFCDGKDTKWTMRIKKVVYFNGFTLKSSAPSTVDGCVSIIIIIIITPQTLPFSPCSRSYLHQGHLSWGPEGSGQLHHVYSSHQAGTGLPSLQHAALPCIVSVVCVCVCVSLPRVPLAVGYVASSCWQLFRNLRRCFYYRHTHTHTLWWSSLEVPLHHSPWQATTFTPPAFSSSPLIHPSPPTLCEKTHIKLFLCTFLNLFSSCTSPMCHVDCHHSTAANDVNDVMTRMLSLVLLLDDDRFRLDSKQMIQFTMSGVLTEIHTVNLTL